MAQQILNPNSLAPNDKLGDTPWDYTAKINDNFTELYSSVEGNTIANRIIINEFADFPEPLLPDTQYYIGGQITIPDTLPASWLDLPGNIEFAGSVVASCLTWNGTGTLFTGVDMSRFRIVNLLLDVPNGTVYNITETTTPTIVNLITASVASCQSLGTINVFGVVVSIINIADTNQGFVFGDKIIILNIGEVSISSTDASFVGVDISAATISTMEMTNTRIVAPAGAVALKGLTNSQNISADQRAGVSSCEFIGGVTPLSGITDDDIRYNFQGNSGIRDSNPDAMITMINNATNTVITASSTDGSNAVLVAGTWTEKDASQYTTNAAGKVSALFEYEIPAPITATLTLEPSSGSNIVIAAYVAIDGVVQVESGAVMRTDNNDPKQLTVIWQEHQSSTTNTDVELYIENRSGTTNILCSGAVLRVR